MDSWWHQRQTVVVITHPIPIYLSRHWSWAWINNYILRETIDLSPHPNPIWVKRLLVKGDPNDVVIIRSMIEMGVFNFVSGGWYWVLGWKHRDYRHALYPYLFHPIKYLRAKFFVTVLIMYVTFVNISFDKCPDHIKSLSTRHNLWRYSQSKKCTWLYS